ncbi:MAG: transferase hexapeptide repeat containing protein [Firmicutes bacterium]|jgi:carbonic anhydrase/acetyltransferase-like protein (isoleucine patch superfamily)|nr:transferase hexapeptide repeat containing protein [Bacillota bacterium]
MNEKNIISYKSLRPSIDSSVYVASGVVVIGDVKIDQGASIWFNSVLRGDIDRIHIGKYTNIQDNSTVHVMGDHPTNIGDYVTVGHNAVVHGCTIGNNCLIGMGSILLGYCKIGDNCIVAAGTLITEGKIIPANSMVMGVPGKVVRTLTDEEVKAIRESAINYNLVAQEYI